MNSKKDLLKDIKYRGMEIGCIRATIITVIVIGIFLFAELLRNMGLKNFGASLRLQESMSREVRILLTFMLTYAICILIMTISIIKGCKRRVEILDKELSQKGLSYEVINRDYIHGISLSNSKDIYNIGRSYTVLTDSNQVYIFSNYAVNEIRWEKRKNSLGFKKYYLVIVMYKELINIAIEKETMKEILTVYKKMGFKTV